MNGTYYINKVTTSIAFIECKVPEQTTSQLVYNHVEDSDKRQPEIFKIHGKFNLFLCALKGLMWHILAVVRFWMLSWRLSQSKLKTHSLDEIALLFIELLLVTCAFIQSGKTLQVYT